MPAESGRQRAEGASHEPDAPGDYVELATISRPWEEWLVRDALVERGIRACVDDAGMENPYRTATGVERVYVLVDDLELARKVLAEAEREAPARRPIRNGPSCLPSARRKSPSAHGADHGCAYVAAAHRFQGNERALRPRGPRVPVWVGGARPSATPSRKA